MTPRSIDVIQREIDEAEQELAEAKRRVVKLHNELGDAQQEAVCMDAGGHRWEKRPAVEGLFCIVCGKPKGRDE